MPFPARSVGAAVSSLGVLFSLSAAAPDAAACGGFFCSSSPVDQTAEHILFTVNADHTITAVVQISYTGDRDAFAWIVPVPGVPVLGADFPDLALNALDTATQPTYFERQCPRFGGMADAGAFTAAGDASADAGAPPVTVLDQKLVGPYETVTLAATSATDLVQWLQAHSYRITDPMIPVLAPYIENGLHFVALRLQADRTASDVTPLEMTYQGDRPMIPLRLTSVAAQPEMGIVTFILDGRKWAPENYVDLKIPDELIEFDQWGNQNNYLKLVSQETDKVGGQAFVTEYARSTSDLLVQMQNQPARTTQGEAARQKLVELLGRFPYVTRLYARMSAEEMVVGSDPTFVVAGDSTDVINIHDLTDPDFDYAQCQTWTPSPPADPCLLAYCGRSGACTPTVSSVSTGAPIAACVCASDATARPTLTAYGRPMIYCEPMRMNLDVATAAGSLIQSACEAYSCGTHGECFAMNGNPTCRCEPGYGAVASQTYDATLGALKTQVTCEPVTDANPPLPSLPAIGQPRLIPPGPSSPSSSGLGGGCSVDPRRPLRPGAELALALGLALAGYSGFRRRTRR